MTDKERFLIFTSNQALQKADAIVMLEGDKFSRIKKSCQLVLDSWADKLIFSGGIHNPSYGSYAYEYCLPTLLKTGIKEEQIVHENISQHTRGQAEEVIKICIQNEWKKIILVASHYHQYRAFLTFLKVLEEQNLQQQLHIINAPVNDLDWFEETGYGKRIDLLQAEFERIETYKKTGHISEYKTAIEYFKWWNTQ